MTPELFTENCASFGLNLSKEQLEKFSLYAALLKEWNEKMNLTSITEEGEVFEKHFYDSALVLKSYSLRGRKVVDVGSGAGFPGVVLALLEPECEVYLIDATKKKFLFLEEVKTKLGLSNLHFIVGRVEDLPSYRESFDACISRGFASLRVFAEVGAPLIFVTGTLIAMKGSKADEEIAEAKNILRLLHLRLRQRSDEELPCGEKRVLLYYAKDERTPKRFPRRWDEIQRTKI